VEPESGWLYQASQGATTTDQLWPAILPHAALSYRVDGRALLDVRRPEAPAFSWVRTAVDATVATWSPIWATHPAIYRSGERPRLDVRGHEWLPEFGWAASQVDRVAGAWSPIWAQTLRSGQRTDARRALDVHHYEWSPSVGSWIAVVLATPIVAATARYIIRVRPDVGTIKARQDVGTIRVRPDDGTVEP
jgi:hypothetical protein